MATKRDLNQALNVEYHKYWPVLCQELDRMPSPTEDDLRGTLLRYVQTVYSAIISPFGVKPVPPELMCSDAEPENAAAALYARVYNCVTGKPTPVASLKIHAEEARHWTNTALEHAGLEPRL